MAIFTKNENKFHIHNTQIIKGESIGTFYPLWLQYDSQPLPDIIKVHATFIERNQKEAFVEINFSIFILEFSLWWEHITPENFKILSYKSYNYDIWVNLIFKVTPNEDLIFEMVTFSRLTPAIQNIISTNKILPSYISDKRKYKLSNLNISEL